MRKRLHCPHSAIPLGCLKAVRVTSCSVLLESCISFPCCWCLWVGPQHRCRVPSKVRGARGEVGAPGHRGTCYVQQASRRHVRRRHWLWRAAADRPRVSAVDAGFVPILGQHVFREPTAKWCATWLGELSVLSSNPPHPVLSCHRLTALFHGQEYGVLSGRLVLLCRRPSGSFLWLTVC